MNLLLVLYSCRLVLLRTSHTVSQKTDQASALGAKKSRVLASFAKPELCRTYALTSLSFTLFNVTTVISGHSCQTTTSSSSLALLLVLPTPVLGMQQRQLLSQKTLQPPIPQSLAHRQRTNKTHRTQLSSLGSNTF